MATLQEADLRLHLKWHSSDNAAERYCKDFFFFFFRHFMNPTQLAHSAESCARRVCCQTHTHVASLSVCGFTFIAFPPTSVSQVLTEPRVKNTEGGYSTGNRSAVSAFPNLLRSSFDPPILKTELTPRGVLLLLLEVAQMHVAQSWFPSRCL